jgi:hypothetical protein
MSVNMTRSSPAPVVSCYFFGGCNMPNDLIATAQALGQASGGCEPLPNLFREIGLAAVANELNLQLDTLDPDVAEAVERGAAALFPAWYGRSLTRGAVAKRGAWRARQDNPSASRREKLRS